MRREIGSPTTGRSCSRRSPAAIATGSRSWTSPGFRAGRHIPSSGASSSKSSRAPAGKEKGPLIETAAPAGGTTSSRRKGESSSPPRSSGSPSTAASSATRSPSPSRVDETALARSAGGPARGHRSCPLPTATGFVRSGSRSSGTRARKAHPRRRSWVFFATPPRRAG